MTYLPSGYINSHYTYIYNNNYIQVRTNENCVQQYNTTYCDCYNIYYNYDYIVGDKYNCSLSNSSNTINYNNFSSDFYYRLDFDKICIIFFLVITLCYFLAFKPISRLFGRWLKL